MTEDDLETLFEPWEKLVPAPYPTLEQEVAAVATGTKGVSFVEELSSPEDASDDYHQLIDLAGHLQLAVVHLPSEDEFSTTMVYAARPDSLWRSQAHVLLCRTMRNRWSDAAEEMQSKLLGYSDEQISEWMSFLRWGRLGWKGTTVYVLLDPAQRVAFQRSKCCFSPESLEGGLMSLFSVGNSIVKRDISDVLGGYTLGRVALEQDFVKRLFGSSPKYGIVDSVVSLRLDRSHLADLNSNLVSRLEILSDSGWLAT